MQGEEAYVQSTDSYVYRTMPVYVGDAMGGGAKIRREEGSARKRGGVGGKEFVGSL